MHTAASSGEKAVGGCTSGLLGLNDEVTWEARHFGVRQRLASRITAFDQPSFFQDCMTRGAFKSLEHDHHFLNAGDGSTTMIDAMRFQAPGGVFAHALEKFILGPYLRRFLIVRGTSLKRLAESDGWKRFLPAA